MNRLDKRIKRERKQAYKVAKKIFKARDIASKHLSKPLKVSRLVEYFSTYGNEELWSSTTDLAYFIVKKENLIRRTRPPIRPVTAKK
ncbi:TPA: hypothetical protein NJY08_004397 [Salmonella enterica subsp. enterica serovar Typhi str. AG3]|nr:hypothetical protein [Salmonella enterica subsp. enterica serovar Typhi str. AG3]